MCLDFYFYKFVNQTYGALEGYTASGLLAKLGTLLIFLLFLIDVDIPRNRTEFHIVYHLKGLC